MLMVVGVTLERTRRMPSLPIRPQTLRQSDSDTTIPTRAEWAQADQE